MTVRQHRGKRRQPALPARSIAVAVLRTGRRHAGQILLVSIAVSLVVTAVEIAVDHLLSHAGLAAALFGALGSSGVSLLGAVFLAGFLSRLVSAERDGGQARIRDVLRRAALGHADRGRPAGGADRGGRVPAADHPGAGRAQPAGRGRAAIEIEHRRAWPGCAAARSWSARTSGGWPCSARCRCWWSAGWSRCCPTRRAGPGILTALVARSLVEGRAGSGGRPAAGRAVLPVDRRRPGAG